MVLKPLHIGTCHCQAIRFTVHTALDDNTVCDCSHCAKLGIVWGECDLGEFVLERGEKVMTQYEFGLKTYQFFFCQICGTFIAAAKSLRGLVDTGAIEGFNVRALRDIDIHKLECKRNTSAKDRPPVYTPAPPIDHPFEPHPSKVVLYGSCHCHHARFAVHTPPLGVENDGKVQVLDCNCSICAGNGIVWMYPLHGDYHFAPDAVNHMTDYVFTPDGPKQSVFRFCKRCGCSIYGNRQDQPHIGLNIRLIDGIDMDRAGVELWDELSVPPFYTLK